MKTAMTTVYLALAGMLLLVIGGAILFAPHAFHGSNGIALGENPNLLSEIRAPGGLLASSGVIILIGASRRRFRSLTVMLSVLVYGSFGLARLASLALDGTPSSSIVGAMALEFFIAFLGLVILWRWRTDEAADGAFAAAQAHR